MAPGRSKLPDMKADSSLPPLLIVDDNEDDVILLTRLLKRAGVKNPLVHCRTGGDAFLYLKKFCEPAGARTSLPVLMFLDINMQGLSGFDVLLWARQQQPLAAMKIFMLSGANEEWDAQIAAKLGADEFLEKFPEPAVFAELVGPICEVTAR